jgi:hypothetical protein
MSQTIELSPRNVTTESEERIVMIESPAWPVTLNSLPTRR